MCNGAPLHLVKPVPSAIHESVSYIAIVDVIWCWAYLYIMYVHWRTRYTGYVCLLGAVTS